MPAAPPNGGPFCAIPLLDAVFKQTLLVQLQPSASRALNAQKMNSVGSEENKHFVQPHTLRHALPEPVQDAYADLPLHVL